MFPPERQEINDSTFYEALEESCRNINNAKSYGGFIGVAASIPLIIWMHVNPGELLPITSNPFIISGQSILLTGAITLSGFKIGGWISAKREIQKLSQEFNLSKERIAQNIRSELQYF